MNLSIFRAYDIRGTYNLSITQEAAYIIGKSFAKLTSSKNKPIIYVGQDCRLSSPALFQALCQGLYEAGCEIISIGIVPSPMLYFADFINKTMASIMVTGSHNHKNDNGFKILYNGKSLSEMQMHELKNLVAVCNDSYEPKPLDIKTEKVCEQYLKHVLEAVSISPSLKVVWDPGNGATGEIVSKLIPKLPNKNIIINGDMDGNFPNHHPDPTVPENLQQLKRAVLENKSDLGVGFDGDGDRIGVISNSGEFIYADTLMCIFCKDILQQHKNVAMVCDIKSSKVLINLVQKLGGEMHVSKTGHAFIKEKMRQTNAIFGGELSGHLFFKDKYYGYDDAVYAALRLIEILSKNNKNLQQMVDELPRAFNTPEIRIRCSQKFHIIESVKKTLANQNRTFSDLDGVRVDEKDSWWLLRASNTEEYLVLRLEALSQRELDKILDEVRQMLKQYNIEF
jgi:phosphomannomutase